MKCLRLISEERGVVLRFDSWRCEPQRFAIYPYGFLSKPRVPNSNGFSPLYILESIGLRDTAFICTMYMPFLTGHTLNANYFG